MKTFRLVTAASRLRALMKTLVLTSTLLVFASGQLIVEDI